MVEKTNNFVNKILDEESCAYMSVLLIPSIDDDDIILLVIVLCLASPFFRRADIDYFKIIRVQVAFLTQVQLLVRGHHQVGNGSVSLHANFFLLLLQ